MIVLSEREEEEECYQHGYFKERSSLETSIHLLGSWTYHESFFVQRLIDPRPERIVWYYGGDWQQSFANIPNVEFVCGLHFTQNNSNQPLLLIIDDLMCETDENFTKLFTKGCHHQNMSDIYIVQNWFHKGNEHRTISTKGYSTEYHPSSKIRYPLPLGWYTGPIE
jgi:hypothetical protein